MTRFYYSFYLGLRNTNPETWILQDWKICAFNPKEAIIVDQFMKFNCHPNWIKPNTYTILNVYRKVIEFEFRKTEGITRVTYKKVGLYTEKDILKWFK